MVNDQSSSPQPIQSGKPLLRVNVSACEVTFVREGERKAIVNEAREFLVRYGRLDRLEIIKMYQQALQAEGKDLEEMPLVVMTTTEVQADAAAMNYAVGVRAARVNVEVPGAGVMQLKPEVLHFEGLDASKPVSEADPRRYLIMPFQARMGDPRGGILIDPAKFEEWVKGIPR